MIQSVLIPTPIVASMLPVRHAMTAASPTERGDDQPRLHRQPTTEDSQRASDDGRNP